MRKGGGPTLEVARALLARGSDLRILVVGDSDPDLQIRARAFPNVQHLGYVSADNGLPALMRAAVALLFLSRYETFGIPAVEAFAVGTPVVVSHHGALPEVVGDAGAVVNPESAPDIADLLMQLARDANVRKPFIEAGRKAQRAVPLGRLRSPALAAMRGAS